MKRLQHLMATAFIAAPLLLTACDSGIVGPPGPPGRDGADGIVDVFSVNFIFSMNDAVVNGKVASAQYDVPGITPSVVDEGAVLLFFREQGTWTAAPFTYGLENEDPNIDAVDYTVTLGFGYDDGFLEPFYEASIDVDLIPADVLPDREMKAVIIDGFLAGKTAVDHTNWAEVRAAYGLSD